MPFIFFRTVLCSFGSESLKKKKKMKIGADIRENSIEFAKKKLNVKLPYESAFPIFSPSERKENGNSKRCTHP